MEKNTTSFQYHTHKADPLLYHVDSRNSLVRAVRLSSGVSLSWSDKGELYTSAGRRVSQFGIKSDSRHILLKKKNNQVLICALMGCTWGIRRPLHFKCQCSSSYYVHKNKCTVEVAEMSVALPILCSSLHYQPC